MLWIVRTEGFVNMSTVNNFCIAWKSAYENIKIYTKCDPSQFVEM